MRETEFKLLGAGPNSSLRGSALARAVLNSILVDPSQSHWHQSCNDWCFLALCCRAVHGDNWSDACFTGRQLLGISAETARWLYDDTRTIDDIHAFVSAMCVAPTAGSPVMLTSKFEQLPLV